MKVSVLYFGILKDIAGKAQEPLELSAGASVGGLLEVLQLPDAALVKALAVAVNREYAGVKTVLQDGDEVALLPPVSGGNSCAFKS